MDRPVQKHPLLADYEKHRQPIHLAEYVAFCSDCGFVGCSLEGLVAEICIQCGKTRETEEDEEDWDDDAASE